MAKEIKITAEDNEYTLTYTRASIKQMERNGFLIDDVTTKPMTTIPALFAGAFIAKQPLMKNGEVSRLYDQIGDKNKLISMLVEMYTDTLESLLDTKGDQGNISWTPNWQTEE